MLTVDEAAGALAVHPQTVRRMIKRGELAAIKVARHWRVPQAALLELQRQSESATHKPA